MKNKFCFPLYFLFYFAENSTAQSDTSTHKSSFTSETSYIGNTVSNLSGGIKKGSCYLGMANLKITFDTEKAKFWKGGTFFINGANTHGGTPTADLIGDFQGISNIEAGDLTYLHELWIKQTVGKVAITIGIQDLNTEFVSSENAGLFFNGTFGTHSTISDNVPAPVFPLTAFGAQIQYNISDKVTGKLIIFDGFPDDFEDNPHNLKWRFKREDGLLTISEFTLTDTLFKNLTGTYKAGGYSHNHLTTVSRESSKMEPMSNNNYGFYLVADQVIFKNTKGRQLALFAQASVSPYQKNENWYYLGFGFNYHGLSHKRTNDILGFAVASAGFYHGNETILELTYKVQISENIFIQPDFQYVINPSGTDEKLNNAFVANLRFGLTF